MKPSRFYTGILAGLFFTGVAASPSFAGGAASEPGKSAAVAGTTGTSQEFLVWGGHNLRIVNREVKPGITMMDEIGRCASLCKTEGEFVTCLRHLAGGWRKAGLISSAEKNRIVGAGSKTSDPAGMAVAHQASRAVVASASF